MLLAAYKRMDLLSMSRYIDYESDADEYRDLLA